MKRLFRGLTVKQQAKIRSRFFRALREMGFTYTDSPRGGYYMRRISDSDNCNELVCVGFGVNDQCLGGKTNWVWQDATKTTEPAFGYSGSCHVGAEYGTLERLMSITLDRFRSAGFAQGLAVERKASTEAKRKITEAIASLHSI